MVVHATLGRSNRNSALHPAIIWIGGGRVEKWIAWSRSSYIAIGIDTAVPRNETLRVEIKSQIVQLAVRSIETETYSQIQRQTTRSMPVILKIRLVDFVEIMHLQLQLLLREAGYIPQKRIGVSVARGILRAVTVIGKAQYAIRPRWRLGQFVLVGIHKRETELQVMSADNLGDIVAKT